MLEASPVKDLTRILQERQTMKYTAGSDIVVITAGDRKKAGDEPGRPRG